jgi:two-component system copper resistance phosphate regulon response regulator CusR
MTILVVEDEKKLADVLRLALKGEHYTVDVAYDGDEGLKKAMKNNYAVIILDINLPKKSGFTVCRELRAHQIHTPVIFLTARSIMEDRIKGLDMGADDYLIKPFGMDELFARIRTILRRRKTTDGDIWKVSDLTLDTKKHEVTRAGKVLNLTPKEYILLKALISRHGEPLNRGELISSAWGPDFAEANNELNVHIRYLRKKVDSSNSKPLIHTVRGVGFVLKE